MREGSALLDVLPRANCRQSAGLLLSHVQEYTLGYTTPQAQRSSVEVQWSAYDLSVVC